MKQQYNTALYLRLSRDDELKGESGSISTQRDMLTQYCREQNLNIIGEYVDDGWSGTNFDRPSFQRMIDDIEDGKNQLRDHKRPVKARQKLYSHRAIHRLLFPVKGREIYRGQRRRGQRERRK